MGFLFFSLPSLHRIKSKTHLYPKPTVDQTQMLEKFSSSSSDITFRSSDGIEFNVHRALLEANSGAFPGPDIETHGEVVDLEETAEVLEVLFDFMYPKRHPDLSDKKAELILKISEAVEKYEVFSAMFVCCTRLRSILPMHSKEILVHGIKHDYPDLIYDAAPDLPRSSFIWIMGELPASYRLAWARYYDSWTNIFKNAREYVKTMPLITLDTIPGVWRKHRSSSTCHDGTHEASSICAICQNSMFLLITNLEETETMRSLINIVKDPNLYTDIHETQCCNHLSRLEEPRPRWRTDYDPPKREQCSLVSNLLKFIHGQIEEIPLFGKISEE